MTRELLPHDCKFRSLKAPLFSKIDVPACRKLRHTVYDVYFKRIAAALLVGIV